MKIQRFVQLFSLIFFISTADSCFTVAFPQSGNIRIGLLVQDDKSFSAKQAAELAVRKANEKGGFDGKRFELVVKSMEGPWGTGSRQAVDLIFDENVWVLVGSHDGRNAHLVEQAATKSEVVFLSCWSGDPTLSQAFVPWFFNCMPNYNQQAEVIAGDIYYTRKFTRVTAVTDNTYDSNQAFLSFTKKSEATGKYETERIVYEEFMKDPENGSAKIVSESPDCIVLFCSPSASSDFLNRIVRKGYSKPVYGPVYIANEKDLSENGLKIYENTLKVPSGKWDPLIAKDFVTDYRFIYGTNPGMNAAYVYDGVTAVVEAIKSAGGQDRVKIQAALSKMNLAGVTGPLKFDNKGNRTCPLSLTYLKNGIPVL
jgi:branched-chain amino acid transport system substrate-binding protein